MHLPFTTLILTPKTSTWPVVNRSPQRQISGRLASCCRAICILLLLLLTSLSSWAQCAGNIVLSSQAQVNAFPSTCTNFYGDIHIEGADITDLSPLANLQRIFGSLRIINNAKLTSLARFSRLSSVDYEVRIGANAELTNLIGLDNLTRSGGLTIYNNPKLTNLTGLSRFSSTGGRLLIESNAKLTSLSGLENLTTVGSLTIYNNPELTNLTGLSRFSSTGARLLIESNAELTSLSGLENLTTAGGVEISKNPKLTSLAGLNSLGSVGGDVWIKANAELTSLTGLDKLTTASGLFILNNPKLTTCSIASVCQFIVNYPSRTSMSGNATGCASLQEVQDICNPTPVPVITDQPDNTIVCAGAGSTASFSVTASDATGYQWQVDQGSGFVNLSNTAPYSGVTTATLTITNAPAALNGNQYRVEVSGASPPSTTSNAATLTVNSIAVSIPDTKALSQGVEVNTVYYGYTPAASLTLTAQVSGGTGSYQYQWQKNGVNIAGATSASLKVSPTTTTTYAVTITANNSCATTVSKIVRVVDVRCGSKNDKVVVCHKPDRSTLCISKGDVASHLNHGDNLGSCGRTSSAYDLVEAETGVDAENPLTISVLGNPAPEYFTLIPQRGTKADLTLRVIDATGKVIENRTNVSGQSVIELGKSYRAGMYFVEVVQGQQRIALKLMKNPQ